MLLADDSLTLDFQIMDQELVSYGLILELYLFPLQKKQITLFSSVDILVLLL